MGMRLPLAFIGDVSIFLIFCLDLNCIYLVLSEFNFNLIESIHSLMLLSVFFSILFASQALAVSDALYLVPLEWSSANPFMSRLFGVAVVINEQ